MTLKVYFLEIKWIKSPLYCFVLYPVLRWLLNPFRFFRQKNLTLHFVTSINISIILFELQIFTRNTLVYGHTGKVLLFSMWFALLKCVCVRVQALVHHSCSMCMVSIQFFFVFFFFQNASKANILSS